MKQKQSLQLSLLLALGVAMSSPPVRAQPVQREVPLFNFESAADIAAWKTSDLASISASSEWSSQGAQSACINFHAWEPGQQTPPPPSAADAGDAEMLEPAPTAASATGSVKTSILSLQHLADKLSFYDYLKFEAHNPGSETIYFNVALTGKLRSINVTVQLKAGETQTVQLALRESPFLEGAPLTDQIGRYLSSDNADGISFNLPYAPRNVAVNVDNVRLVIDPAAELTSLSKLPYAPQQKITALQQQITASLQNASAAQINTWRENVDLLKSETEKAHQQWNEKQARRAAGASDFALTTESTLHKIFLEKSRFKSTFNNAKAQQLYAARNEAESFQVIIFPAGKDLTNVSWEMSPLRNSAGKTIPASARLVGYVQTKQQPRYHVPFLGWWPDPLMEEVNTLENIPQNEVRALWITAEVPEDSDTGNYTGTLKVTANGKTQQIDVNIEVWGFTLPKRSNLPVLVQLLRLESMSQFAPPAEPKSTESLNNPPKLDVFHL